MSAVGTPLRDTVEEARRVLDAAAAASVPLRVLGGVAIAMSVPGEPLLPRAFNDIDFITARGAGPRTATVITIAGAIAAYAWAVYIAKNFFQVIVYATLAQLITHVLIGVSAISFPYRRRPLYQASVSNKEIAGIPLVVLAGIGAILTSIFLYWAFFHYAFFGLQAKQNITYWVGGAVLFGLLWYIGARLVRRQEGIDIDRVYAEIPPE